MQDEGNAKILIVDDALNTLEVLQRNLSSAGYTVLAASSVAEAVKVLESEPVDLVITDLKMPGATGLDLIRHVRENLRNTEVMMITGYATIEGAVEAVKTGAEEYLSKPFTDEELFASVKRALDKLYLRRAGQALGGPLPAFQGLIGESEAIKKVFASVLKAAAAPVTVLITGESGTGKELVARAIHYGSSRASAPFVPVNCGGIPEGLLESELFGYMKGAFTGAYETRAGFFQIADGGAIFLDEISEATLSMQVKLLRVLQNREVCMVGDNRTRHVDVRVLAATNKNLLELVKKGAFREDLFYRLNVITIAVPALRDRDDDVMRLAAHFAQKFFQELGKPSPRFGSGVVELFTHYSWPGNVRELENVVQQLAVMTEGGTVEVADLPPHMRHALPRSQNGARTLREVEAEHIRAVLAVTGGNKSRAATILGIDRKTLREKIKHYALE